MILTAFLCNKVEYNAQIITNIDEALAEPNFVLY